MYIFFLCSGQQIEILRERPDNEHRWEVKSDGEKVGFVLSSSDIIKEQKALPWLQKALLISEEEDGKVHGMTLRQQQVARYMDMATGCAQDGTGFGPFPGI